MVKNWDKYTRNTIDLASQASSIGFNAAKSSTRYGFSVTRNIVTSAVGITSAVVDNALFGGSTVSRPVLETAAIRVISFCEQLTLAPIFLSEYVTTTSLIAAHSSINALSVFFPGSSDASFSLASFITLVRREWVSGDIPGAPEKQYGIMKVARGIVAWVALQGVTQEWQEKIWFKHLREIRVNDATPHSHRSLSRRSSRVRVTSDVIFPGNKAQIIAADIGEAPSRTISQPSSPTASIHSLSTRKFTLSPFTPVNSLPSHSSHSHHYSHLHAPPSPTIPYHSHIHIDHIPRLSPHELKSTLRRLSKIVLAGYGGASLLFFGVSPSIRHTPTSAAAAMASEEAELTHAIAASEAEAIGEGEDPDHPGSPAEEAEPEYSWWDVLLGKHDQEIFERAAGVGRKSEMAKKELKAKMNATAVIGSEHMMPRFWVLTDHGRAQVVLVLRGTMSLNEIAADLTCEPEDFEPATTPDESPDELHQYPPGRFSFPSKSSTSRPSSTTAPRYHVHSGMLRMARVMGEPGKPVQLAVQEALMYNPDYELVLCGHSLGAGVAAILGLMWADPRTCLTVPQGGLPTGRRVSVYCFAPPALADAALSRLASKLIVSFVYSHDVVSRLSLGSVRDLKTAAMWLCEAEQEGGGEGWGAVTTRAKRWTAGAGGDDDEASWFIAVRKTLEANMQMSNMFPPGRVLWAMRDSDLHPSHRSTATHHPSPITNGSTIGSKPELHLDKDKLRLFEVLDVERVFSQLVFARDMLTAHMPHQYDRVLHDLL